MVRVTRRGGPEKGEFEHDSPAAPTPRTVRYAGFSVPVAMTAMPAELEGDLRYIVPGRFAWCCFPQKVLDATPEPELAGARLFCIDQTLVYEQFFADFGPLNLACLVKYCRMTAALLKECAERKVVLVHYCSDHRHRRTNAALLACAFAVVVLRRTVRQAYAPFLDVTPVLHPYRDAGFGVCTYQMHALDALRGVAKAQALGHFDYASFDVAEYEKMERLENGDCAWLVPRKFIAFSSPLARRREIAPGVYTFSAEDYVPLFQRLGVTCIIRFNKKLYDKRKFTQAGIRHVELFYEDGSNPSEQIMQRFIQICENEPGAIAVHCKAGLGRTGTNIGAYMMKHWGYTATECMGWMRICRPGSVIGPQQQFVMDAEERLWREGEIFRRQRSNWPEQPVADHKPPPAAADLAPYLPTFQSNNGHGAKKHGYRRSTG